MEIRPKAGTLTIKGGSFIIQGMAKESLSKAERTNRGEIGFQEALGIAREVIAEYGAKLKKKREKNQEQYTIPKTLIFVCGYEGSGKSRTAKALTRTVPIAYINKDPISDIFSESRKDQVHKNTRDRAYEVVYTLAEEYLASGQSVILDAPFDDPRFFKNKEWKERMQSIADAHGAEIKILWCAASQKDRLKRILERDRPRDRDRTYEEKVALSKKKGVPEMPFPHTVHHIKRPNPGKLIRFLGIEKKGKEKKNTSRGEEESAAQGA